MIKYFSPVMLAAMIVMSFSLFASCDEGEDPAQMMLQQSGGATSTTLPPVEKAADTATSAPVVEEAGGTTDEGIAGGDVAETAATEVDEAVEAEDAEVAAEEPGEADEALVEGEADDDEVEANGSAAVGEEASEIVEEILDEMMEGIEGIEGVVDAEDLGEMLEAVEGFIEDEQDSGDPIENFKNLDPRDIITRKYEDMEGRKTEPWNDEDPEHFIPRTGRVDPMTRVRESVPDELKPPRAGETDQNDINSYVIASEATMMVDALAQALQCHNVIQVGLVKYATFSIGGRQFARGEGEGASWAVGSQTGLTIMMGFNVTSISSTQVRVAISASGQGTSVRISKNVVFIPANQY